MNTQPYQLTQAGKNLWKNQLIPQRNRFLVEELEKAVRRMGQSNVDPSVHEIAHKKCNGP